MDLLTNAVESIRVGVADWDEGSRPRILSAVRGIHAGILLLFKEELLRRSPADSNGVLIKERVQPVPDGQGGVRFVGTGKRTVTSQQIKERFKSLGIVADWTKVDAIADVRNEVEHYFADVTKESTRDVIADAYLVIRDFAESVLNEDPRELLGTETWEVMLRTEALFSVEKVACDAAMASIHWGSDSLFQGVKELRCGKCGSRLLTPTGSGSLSSIELECRTCGELEDPDSFIPRALEEALGAEAYISMESGGDEPLVACPSCGSETYVVSENRCASCGEEVDRDCSACGTTIPTSELDFAPLCGWCAHRMSKDD